MEKTVKIPKKEFIEEHERLIPKLRGKEKAMQSKELENVKEDKAEGGQEEDLHAGKDSHLSTPVAHDVEFHIRKSEINHDCKVGDKYMVEVPCEVTSADDEMTRFKQIKPLEIEPMEEEKKEENYAKMPMDKLRDKVKSASEKDEY